MCVCACVCEGKSECECAGDPLPQLTKLTASVVSGKESILNGMAGRVVRQPIEGRSFSAGA